MNSVKELMNEFEEMHTGSIKMEIKITHEGDNTSLEISSKVNATRPMLSGAIVHLLLQVSEQEGKGEALSLYQEALLNFYAQLKSKGELDED